MGKSWDSDKGNRDNWIAWLAEIMREAYRVLKPGAHGLIWALPRTSHWTATALENAGFEIRDAVYHIFGSGFPKSHNVSLAVDKYLKAEREVIGERAYTNPKMEAGKGVSGLKWSGSYAGEYNGERVRVPITGPATPEAAQWDGWGTALKPAVETWWLVRKPLAEKSIAANVLTWGVGGINIDGCRVETEEVKQVDRLRHGGIWNGEGDNSIRHVGSGTSHTAGRWPSHLLLSHTIECVLSGTKQVRGNRGFEGYTGARTEHIYGSYDIKGRKHTGDENGLETVESWECAPYCPVRLMDEQSGTRKSGGRNHTVGESFNWQGASDSGRAKVSSYEASEGGASRYFQQFTPEPPFIYTSKASRKERNAGCEALPEKPKKDIYGQGFNSATKVCTEEQAKNGVNRGGTTNNHPCVKPISLMSYLVRMITPPGGTVLDCFAGSGSTLVAAAREGFHYIGIEKEPDYVSIIQSRLAHEQNRS